MTVQAATGNTNAQVISRWTMTVFTGAKHFIVIDTGSRHEAAGIVTGGTKISGRNMIEASAHGNSIIMTSDTITDDLAVIHLAYAGP